MGRAKRAGPKHGFFARPEHETARFKWAVARHGPVSARAENRFEARGPARQGTIRPFLFLFFIYFTYFYLFWDVLVLMDRIRAHGSCLNLARRAIFVLMGRAGRATEIGRAHV